MAIIEPLDIYTPKHHMCFHLILRIARHGNPLEYQNFFDEHVNKSFKKVCRNLSQLKFEPMLYRKMKGLLTGAPRKRRRLEK